MDASLQRLAEACGVATSYDDWAHRPVPVSEATVRRVLAGLGIDASDPAAALADWEARRWAQVLPPTVVVRRHAPKPVPLRCPAESPLRVEITLESHDRMDVAFSSPVDREGGWVERLVTIPPELPLGEHRLMAYLDDRPAADVLLVVAPDQLPLPPTAAVGLGGAALRRPQCLGHG